MLRKTTQPEPNKRRLDPIEAQIMLHLMGCWGCRTTTRDLCEHVNADRRELLKSLTKLKEDKFIKVLEWNGGSKTVWKALIK